jgi:uncharacterized protein
MRLLAVVVAAVVVAVGLLWLAQRRLIYLPSQVVPPIGSVLPAAEEVAYATDDGLILAAWLVPASGEPSGITVIVFNGNAGNRAHRAPVAEALASLGHRVLLTDYRGYGGNPGRPTETGLAADARAAVAHLEDRGDVDPERLVYFGESLGAAVAIGLAVERPPAALVLRSPFTSLPDVASVHYPFLPTSWLLWDRYPNLDRMRTLTVPLLVVAGTEDRIVPFAQSEALYATAPGPKELMAVDGADHNDHRLNAGEAMLARVDAFVRRWG